MAKKDSVQMLRDKIAILNETKKQPIVAESICWAMQRSYATQEEEAYYDLKEYIRTSLGTTTWLEFWIETERPELKSDNAYMASYRLQWIDWMLQCLNEDLEEKLAKGNKA